MAFYKFVLLAVSLLVATSSTAPQNTKFGITIPQKCRGKGFCSIRPDGYDQIEAQINALFPPGLIKDGSWSGNDRIGETYDDDDNDNCPSVKTWESVYTYDDPKGKTKMDIIVQTELFPQLVAKVTCKYGNNEYKKLKEGGSQCFRTLGLSAFNMESSCQESYATRTLMVYYPEEGILKMKNYTVPVCCSCQTRKK